MSRHACNSESLFTFDFVDPENGAWLGVGYLSEKDPCWSFGARPAEVNCKERGVLESTDTRAIYYMILATSSVVVRKRHLSGHEDDEMIDMVDIGDRNDELRLAHLLEVNLRLEKTSRRCSIRPCRTNDSPVGRQ